MKILVCTIMSGFCKSGHKSWGKSGDMLSSSLSGTFNSLLWSGADAIINARDPMQNPGQTWIFYKAGQTRLTRTKCDPIDRIDTTLFQPHFVMLPDLSWSLDCKTIFLTLYRVDYVRIVLDRRSIDTYILIHFTTFILLHITI